MEPRYTYFKEIHLDTEKRFVIDLTKNNSIKKIKFSPRWNYFVTNLKVNAKIKTDVKKKMKRLRQNPSTIWILLFAKYKWQKTPKIIHDVILIMKNVDKFKHEYFSWILRNLQILQCNRKKLSPLHLNLHTNNLETVGYFLNTKATYFKYWFQKIFNWLKKNMIGGKNNLT